MRIVTNSEHGRHDPPFEILDGRVSPYHEAPRRATIIAEALAAAGFPAPEAARSFGPEPLLAVHDADYLAYLEGAYQAWVAAGLPEEAVMPCNFLLPGLRAGSHSPQALAGRYTFDLSAPITAGTFAAARGSADTALTGAALLLEGERSAYALCRPPGHHAARALAGGFCYLNNAAVAAHYLAAADEGRRTKDEGGAAGQAYLVAADEGRRTKDEGGAAGQAYLVAADEGRRTKDEGGAAGHAAGAIKGDAATDLADPSSLAFGRSSPYWAMRPAVVAILDIDLHHGNGTQAIFYERSDVFFVSLHADPEREYPYFLGFADECGAHAGEGYNLNLPLPKGVNDAGYLAALDGALEAIAGYAPRYLVVSAGLDTFGGDPLGDFMLTTAGYGRIGARIAQLGLPTLFVQEGGYAIDDLGRNVASLLRGFEEG